MKPEKNGVPTELSELTGPQKMLAGAAIMGTALMPLVYRLLQGHTEQPVQDKDILQQHNIFGEL